MRRLSTSVSKICYYWALDFHFFFLFFRQYLGLRYHIRETSKNIFEGFYSNFFFRSEYRLRHCHVIDAVLPLFLVLIEPESRVIVALGNEKPFEVRSAVEEALIV